MDILKNLVMVTGYELQVWRNSAGPFRETWLYSEQIQRYEDTMRLQRWRFREVMAGEN